DAESAPTERPQEITRRKDLPAAQWKDKRQHPSRQLLWSGPRLHPDLARHTIHAVTLSKKGRLLRADGRRDNAVVVRSRAPENRSRGHRAHLHLGHLIRMACAADLPRHTEIAWIHEANEPGVLLIEERVGLLGIRRGIPAVRAFPRFRDTRLDMRLARGLVLRRRASLHP